MTQIGYHASHEQFPPSELVRLAVAAEQAGFDCAKSSDHIHPWSERQGHSGFAWSWLGAAMQATSLPCGSIAAPGYRYHPAILAQAAATIGEMFPERFWLALGTGEALNETITGQVWPEKSERNAILAECVEIFRALFAGETVTHRGRVTVVEAKLYSLPANPVPLFGSAVTPATAKFCAGWADGLLTLGGESDKVREVVEAFRAHGGEGKPIHVQHTLSWDTTEAAALASAIDQWGPLIAGGDVNWDLRRPRDFDTVGKLANADNIGRSVKVSADLGQHAQWLAELAELGVTAIHLHCVGRNQAAFLDAFGAKVLPQLR
jgi:coenzyme F420-dependent glucose-6-phosphate dehydrogenase